MRKSVGKIIFRSVVPALIPLIVLASTVLADTPAFERCLMEKLRNATPDRTVGEIREECRRCLEALAAAPPATATCQEAPEELEPIELTAVGRRLQEEDATEDRPFVITPHKQNYVLPLSYNSKPNAAPLTWQDGDIDYTEVKFQISLKYKLLEDLYRNNWDLYVAYTNLSFWQAYNDKTSSPFRETNHEPEIWLAYQNDWRILGLENSLIRLGASHQSNGRGGTSSRSWNRLYLDFLLSSGNFSVNLKPWYRIPESGKDYPGDPTGDDNPDISEYMGYGEMAAAYSWRDQEFTVMFRNNMRGAHNRSSFEVGWSFPMYRKLKGYVQYYYGYGESLIDYDVLSNRIGVGVLLTDWL